MPAHSHIERVVLDPPPDHLRGQLARRAATLSTDETAAARKLGPSSRAQLQVLPAASVLAGEDALQEPETWLAEFHAQGLAAELARQVEQSRASRLAETRPRGRESYELLYLVFATGKTTALHAFRASVSQAVLAACGFTRRPRYDKVALRFAELERDAAAFAAVKDLLVRLALATAPWLLDVVFVDGVAWSTSARVEDACQRKCDRAKRPRVQPGDEFLVERASEVDDPGWGENDRPETAGTRRPYVEVVHGGKRTRTYGVYHAQNHDLRSRDYEAGLRTYRNGKSWFGGLALAAIPAAIGEPVALVHAPADVNEYDLHPALMDAILGGVGRYPKIVSSDRALFVRKAAEFYTRRGIALLTPERVIPGRREHQDWRHDLFDEDGVPRCQACGGPGNQAAPGCGLDLSSRTPALTFRCLLPLRPGCHALQRVPCDVEWLKLRPLSLLLELPHAIAERHSTFESAFRRLRQRQHVVEREKTARLGRIGVAAQQLRTDASLLVLWFRLALRNGWLTPLAIDVAVNSSQRVLLSARQDRRTLAQQRAGIGSTRLRRLQTERYASGLHRPHGPAWNNFLASLRE